MVQTFKGQWYQCPNLMNLSRVKNSLNSDSGWKDEGLKVVEFGEKSVSHKFDINFANY